MSKTQDDINDVVRLINNHVVRYRSELGKLSEIASSLKHEIDYLSPSCDRRLLDIYSTLRDYIREKAEIKQDISDSSIDAAMEMFFQSAEEY